MTPERSGLDAEQVLAEYEGMMGYIVRGILPPGEVEDCLAQVRARVWEKLPGYDGEKASLATWITALSRNAAYDRLRQLKRRGEREEGLAEDRPDPAPGPEEELLRRERLEELQRALERLRPGERRLFYRKYYYLQSTAQIAAELGMSPRAVEGKLYRIRGRLRQWLGGEGP